MINKRPLAFTIPLGIAAVAIAVSQIVIPGSRILTTPSSLFWVAMAIMVAVIPVRRLIGTHHINLGSLIVFTTLLLYGTGTAVVAAWGAGLASVVSTYSGNVRSNTWRAMLVSGKYVCATALAGLTLWGTALNRSAVDWGLGGGMVPGMLAAYASYLGIRWTIEMLSASLRDDRPLRDNRLPAFDRTGLMTWVIPPAAYLLATAYLQSALLTTTMLISVLLVQGLTAADDRLSRSSWVRLTDGLRQACDGHVTRHKGETQRVVEIATAIGRKMKLPPANLRLLGHAAALHNIGYVALDSGLVLRPGRLSPEDIVAVRQHPDCGRMILKDVAGMAAAAEIVRSHHESPDGTGYPRGLQGDAIPIEAAIVKLVEAFVAMTSPRVYRGKTMPRDEALSEIANATGAAFDPIPAYHLFEIMGRSDLASDVSRRFGLPEKRAIRARLSKIGLGSEHRRMRATRGAIVKGLMLLGAAIGGAVLFDRLGISNPMQAPPIWFALELPGALLLLSLLGLAALRPARLAWGAYCSWATAVVLAMVMAGGAIYIPISGMAFIGWALLLRPAPAGRVRPERTDSQAGKPYGQAEKETLGDERRTGGEHLHVQAHELHTNRFHHRVIARIRAANRANGQLGGATYGLVLMVAASFAWLAGSAGYRLWGGSIVGLILSPLLTGLISITAFYMAETFLQAALLVPGCLSPMRTWYRNYTGSFPEPLTYCMIGYGVYVVSGLLGLWAAVLVFALPTVWRQRVLLDRIRIRSTTAGLVGSIAKAVDLKNAPSGTHARGVATMAVAIARQMRKSEAFVEQVEHAAVLHDIGKASWPNKALTQRMPWDTKEERYRYIHPGISAEIARKAGYPPSTTEMIRSHHEHYDGSGYMQGLKAEQIPLGARILCAADSFANMVHCGDPRFSRTLAEAVRELRFGAGKQFAPEVVRALVEVLETSVFGEPVKQKAIEPAETPEDAGAVPPAGHGLSRALPPYGRLRPEEPSRTPGP